MRIARTVPYDRTYEVNEEHLNPRDEGVTHRAVVCLVGECDVWAHGPDQWFGGIMDRPTHVEVLREQMRATCGRDECPHPIEGVLTNRTRKGQRDSQRGERPVGATRRTPMQRGGGWGGTVDTADPTVAERTDSDVPRGAAR